MSNGAFGEESAVKLFYTGILFLKLENDVEIILPTPVRLRGFRLGRRDTRVARTFARRVAVGISDVAEVPGARRLDAFAGGWIGLGNGACRRG